MSKWLGLLLYMVVGTSLLMAEEPPIPVACYQSSARAKSIDDYISCFDERAVIIDVGRTITGRDAIRRWASQEVIPQGDTFKTLEILDKGTGYYKTLVNWLSFKAHYYYWFTEVGKITKMSLQYTDTGTTDRKSVYDQLPSAVKLYFDSVNAESSGMLEECFLPDAYIRVVSRRFNGKGQIIQFAETEVYGGKYYLMDMQNKTKDNVIINLRFTPQSWSSPEPDAVYDIYLKNGLIEHMDLQYAK
jgi:hypothetical protein